MESSNLGTHEALTVAMWVRTDSLQNRWNPLLFCNDGQAGAVHFSLLSDGTPNVAINTGDWNWTHRKAQISVADGNWHHLILVCDARLNGTARFYVDGKPAGKYGLGLGRLLNLYGFRIGAWNNWEKIPANNFHGQLADVQIFSGTLTDDEAAGLAQH